MTTAKTHLASLSHLKSVCHNSALHDSLSHPDLAQSRTSQEGRENIVEFYDAFSNVEQAAVALMVEYLDGGSLQDIVDDVSSPCFSCVSSRSIRLIHAPRSMSQGGCHVEEVLASISQQALRGLCFLHKDSQLHRDLKPANMLINRRGEVKVRSAHSRICLALRWGNVRVCGCTDRRFWHRATRWRISLEGSVRHGSGRC